MKLILGKGNNGTAEMQRYFSHVPGTIDLWEIEADLMVAQEELYKYVGEPLVAAAVAHYYADPAEDAEEAVEPSALPEGGWDEEGEGEGEEEPLPVLSDPERWWLFDRLVELMQNAVTLLGYREYALNNDATHTKTGRMARMDKDTDEWTEKLIDRDDFALQRKGQKAITRLIKFVTKWQFPEFVGHEPYTSTRDLYLWNSSVFHRFHPIEHDDRLFMLMLPMNRSVQQDYIEPVLEAERRINILRDAQAGVWPDPENKVLFDKIGYAIAYLTLAKGYKELPVQLFPESMSRNFWSAGNGAAFITFRDKLSDDTHREGMRKLQVLMMHLEKMRADEADTVITDEEIITIVDRMDAGNKFVRV